MPKRPGSGGIVTGAQNSWRAQKAHCAVQIKVLATEFSMQHVSRFSSLAHHSARRTLGLTVVACAVALSGCATQTGHADAQGAAATNAASTPDSIAQTSWTLTQWNAGQSTTPRHAAVNSMGKPIKLDFLARGKEYFVAGFSGCNLFRGDYAMEKGRLVITAPASTRMACPSPADAGVERDFLKALGSISQFTLDSAGAPRKLTLTINSGDTLEFTRGQDPDKPTR